MASNKKTASAFAQLLAKVAKLEQRPTKSSRRAHKSTSAVTTMTAMAPTPIDGAGPVSHVGPSVVALN